MRLSKSHIIQKARIVVQILFLCTFFLFFFSSGNSINDAGGSTSYFFYLDPLMPLLNFLATGGFIITFMFSLVTIVSSLLFGRIFCGWICPLGSINHFFSWLFKKFNKAEEKLTPQLLKIKYAVLLIIIIAALLGTNLGGWFDPISILTRTSAALVAPAEYLIDYHAEILRDENVAAINRADEISKNNPIENHQHTTSQPYLISGLFIIILLMNYYKRRFYCNTICPLGAFLGLVSRLCLFRVASTPGCISCKQCNSGCTYNGNPDDEFISSECTVCYNCVVECPTDSVEYKFLLPIKKQNMQVDLGRRKVIGAAIIGLVAAALPQSSIQAKSKTRHQYLRPPGSVNESDFLDKCMRCGQCVNSCPTSFIQPAFAETGFGGIWTPVLNAQAGYCIFECNNCTQVCPSKAIETLSLKEKQNFKLGTAVIDRNKCFTYADGMNCTICEEACPTPEKAIRFRAAETWNFQGKQKIVNQIYVIPHLCIGCGICEYACPRNDSPGIAITPEDEIREKVNGDV